jgi:hypothetical protein
MNVIMTVRGVIMCAMIMRAVSVFIVIVLAVIVRCMGRRCPMAGGIGAAFGIEWRLDLDDARAEALHHFLDDVIAPDPQRLAHDLRRQMAIAEMPGKANQMEWVVTANFEQRFRGGHDFDETPVLQNQRIAAAQRHRGFEVEQEFQPARTGHGHPPPVAVVEVQHDGIGRRLCPMVLSLDLCRADHLTVSRRCRR